MKKHFLIYLIAFVPFFASAQLTPVKTIVSRVTDSTATVPSGWGAIRFNAQRTVPAWQFYNGSSWELLGSASGGVTDHGALTGLADDDHTQYHNDTRGDARYGQLSSDNTWTGNNAFRNETRTETGTTYTIQSTDEGLTIEFTNSSDITVTLPNGLAQYFNCMLMKKGTGDVIITATGTLEAAGTPTITTQHTGAYVEHKGSNTWEAIGSFGGGGSFTLTDGSGTTANSTAVDLGGTLTSNADIGVASGFQFDVSTTVSSGSRGSFNVYNSGSDNNKRATINGQIVSGQPFALSFGRSTTYGDGARFYDSRSTTTGIEYSADYSSGYTSRSLVDKAYVQSLIPTLGAGVGTWLATPSWTNFLAAITGTAPYYSLASGGTLTGVNTITSNAVDQIIYTGTATATGTGQYFFKKTPTLTFSNNASHVIGIEQIGGTLNAGANSQVLRGLVINPTYSFSGFTRANYSNLGLDIRDGNGNGFKFYTDAFTNTNNSFQIVNPSGVTTGEMVVDASGFAISSNSGKTLTFNSGSTFRNLIAGARMTELATVTLDVSRNLFGPAWAGTSVTSTANQLGSNSFFAFQGRGWNGSSAVTTYLYDTYTASTATNLLFNSDKRFWNGSTTTDIWRISSAGRMFLGGATNPTALLHLAAGTSSASTAPLKIENGTLMTTPENNAIENDGTNLYFTVGGERKQLNNEGTIFKYAAGTSATGNYDYNMFLTNTIVDAVCEATVTVFGVSSDGSQQFSKKMIASFKKDGTANMVQIGSTTDVHSVSDGLTTPTATLSANVDNFRISWNSGTGSPTLRWVLFVELKYLAY